MQVSTSPRPHRGHRHRLLRFNATTRVAILVQATTTAALGWFSPGSLTARLLADGGTIGQMVLLALSVLVCIGWADVVVNDVLPARWTLMAVRRREHMGYMLLGAVYWAQAMGSTSQHIQGSEVLLANYLMIGGVCCWYSWISVMRGGRHG